MKYIFSSIFTLIFSITLSAQSKMCFKALANNKYVTVVDGILYANADSESDATLFEIYNTGNISFRLDGKCISLNEDLNLFVNESDGCVPEFFKINILEEGEPEIDAMVTSDGKFVCADIGLEGKLIGNRSKQGAWEKFIIIYK